MKNQFYVDFHIIQTVPPSCVNRDDTGRPKTAVYGGVNRARVSSQAWKHAMREMFKELFRDEDLGFRTKHVVRCITKYLVQNGMDEEQATKKAVEALEFAGIKTNSKKANTTDVLFFISALQAKKLAELIENGEKDKKLYKEALKLLPSVDIALFGRMVASDVDLNVDASSQVAHSISTHAIQNEYDYFTAVDDCAPADNAGAGHLGTMEFYSATLYRYATINVTDLAKTIEKDTANAVKGFAEAWIRSMPTGKQNSYANGTLPDMVYVTIRKDQPINLAGAFEKPISGHDGFSQKSQDALLQYANQIYADYGEPVQSFVMGHETVSGAERVNIQQLLDELYKIVTEEVV